MTWLGDNYETIGLWFGLNFGGLWWENFMCCLLKLVNGLC